MYLSLSLSLYICVHVSINDLIYELFAGDIGGTMGLFLGASFLSILEIVDFLLHRVVQRKVAHKIDDKKT